MSLESSSKGDLKMAKNENMFKKAAQTRKVEQNEIKAKLSDTVAETIEEDVPRTTMTISLSVEEKFRLKTLAMKKGKTTSGLIQQWIAENWEE